MVIIDWGKAMKCNISRTKRSYEFHMAESHWHTHYEFYYLYSGHCKIFINHTLYYVEPGDIIFLKPGEIHRTTYHSSPVNERVTISFDGEYLDSMKELCGEENVEYIFRNSKVTVPNGNRSRVEELISRIEYEETGQDGFSPLMKRGCFYELLVSLSRCQEAETDHGRLELGEETIEEATKYIYDHYQNPITLEEVAELSHMSPAYFSRKFKAVTGFGYKEYLTNIRIREASRLLLNSGCSVTEIADRCGFGDGNYFGDAFRKAKGVSPRAFRKMQGGV